MKNDQDLERINRVNFRACLEALARPGQLQEIQPLFNSGLQAMASVLLYAEVSYCYKGEEDFQMIEAICGAKTSSPEEADYQFSDRPDTDFLLDAKVGTAERPELGATLIVQCRKLTGEGIPVLLSGPGIESTARAILPVDTQFLEELKVKNDAFPMGVDILFLSENGQLLGLPRTTEIEEAS